MTREEKIEALEAYCRSITYHACEENRCLVHLRPDDGGEDECVNFDERTDEQLDDALRAIGELDPKPEALDHPGHYNRDGAMECIEEMLLLFGPAETMAFCKLNAWKYRYRAADKGGAEDLKKSDRYLAIYKELKERTR